MPAVGAGVEELRVWCEQGTFRVVYLARLADAIFVLHAFQKKTRTTAKPISRSPHVVIVN